MNLFSFYKLDETALRVSNFRRIGHSLTNNLSARTHGFEAKDTAEAAYDVLDAANTVAGVVANVAAWAAPLSTFAETAFVVTLTGPTFGTISGVVALAKLGYDAYSNREKRHEVLRQYVWSLLDDAPPAKNIFDSDDNREDAAGAATYLMAEAAAQYKLMGSKLYDAQVGFNVFWIQFEQDIAPILTSPGCVAVKISAYDTAALVPGFFNNLPSNRATVEVRYRMEQDILKIHQANKNLKEAVEVGGAVFEFMRRLVHMGNYLQAPYIIHLATLATLNKKIEKYEKGRFTQNKVLKYKSKDFTLGGTTSASPSTTPYEKPKFLNDELANWEMAVMYRTKMRAYSSAIVKVSADLAAATAWVEQRKKNGRKKSDSDNTEFVSERRMEMIGLRVAKGTHINP